MTSFTQKFSVANADVTTLGFATLDDSGGTSGVVTVVANRAGCPTGARTAIAWYDTTKPATADQETTAWVTGSVEASGSYVDIGVLGKQAAASFSTVPKGLWARLYYLANGARRLSLYRFLPDDSAAAAIRTIDLVTAGSVEVPRYRGVLTQAGALGALQMVRVSAVATDAGYILRCFLNTESDDAPILEAVVSGDFTGTGDSNQPYGCWWIGFGASGTSHGTSVAYVGGLDYDASDDNALQDLRADQIPLAEARRRVRERYERGTASAIPDSMIDGAIRDTVEEMIESCGDAATFLWREDTVTLSPDPITGRVTLTPVMRRVLSIVEDSFGTPIQWSLDAQAASGAPVLTVETNSGSHTVRYIMRHRQPSKDTDPVPIPREHTETVIHGACMRLALTEGKTAQIQTFGLLYSGGKSAMLTSLARDMNQTKPVIAPPMFPRFYGGSRGWRVF